MAEKLKLISKQIHWSSLLRAAIFALAWFILPFWLFILLALYLYFVPFSEAQKVIGPFLMLLLLCALEPRTYLFMAIFGIIFLYMLLIKNLLLIDRKSAYEILVFFLSFILFRDFYVRFGEAPGGTSFLYAFLAAILFGILFASFIACFSEVSPEEASLRRVANWLAVFVAWQMLIVGLFLPLDYSYQAAIVFLVMVLFIDFVSQYLFRDISRTKMITTASVVSAVLFVILGSARWGL